MDNRAKVAAHSYATEIEPQTKGASTPITQRGLVFPGEPNACGERGPIDADKLLLHILRRA
jgi:hypothetical protein